MFGLTAILTILFHLAPNLGGVAWSIYQSKGVHLVAPQSSKGSTMKPKIVIHNHYQKPTRDAGLELVQYNSGRWGFKLSNGKVVGPFPSKAAAEKAMREFPDNRQ